MSTKGYIILGVIILAILISGGTIIGGYNNLVQQQQQVKQEESRYGAALDLGSQKIEAVWTIYTTYLSHESELFENATKLRAQFYKSASEGDPKATVNAALAFQLLSVKEAFPQLVSAPIAKDTQRSFEESINEMKTALDDWITATQVYNTQRTIFPNNVIGNAFNFPREYNYYHSENVRLNVSVILNK